MDSSDSDYHTPTPSPDPAEVGQSSTPTMKELRRNHMASVSSRRNKDSESRTSRAKAQSRAAEKSNRNTMLENASNGRMFDDANEASAIGRKNITAKPGNRRTAISAIVEQRRVDKNQRKNASDQEQSHNIECSGNKFNKLCQLFKPKGAMKNDGHAQWLLSGMRSALQDHQLLGVARCRRMEANENGPKGGILADLMGLGKTIQMLANIKADMHEAPEGTTLIVADTCLIHEWQTQIDNHFENGVFDDILLLDAHMLSGLGSCQKVIKVLQGYRLVFTTYHCVMQSYPKVKRPSVRQQLDPEEFLARQQDFESQAGALHRTNFHRIIFDEAAKCKNYRTRTSEACYHLNAKHIWLLSGTPLHNDLTETFPYLRMLGVPCTDTFDAFKRHYLADDASNLRKTWEEVMIRRTYKTRINGRPIVTLPNCHSVTEHITPRLTELKIYDHFAEIIKLKIATLMKQYKKNDPLLMKEIMKLVIRLRQFASHFFLILHMVGLGSPEPLKELILEAGPGTEPSLTKADAVNMQEFMTEYACELSDGKKAYWRFQRANDAMNAGKDLKPDEKEALRRGPRKQPHFKIKHWLEKQGKLLLSSKMAATIAYLEKWMAQESEPKIVVFTQWLEVIRILKEVCGTKTWGCETYHGEKGSEARKKALNRFRNDPSKRIILVSLKAGGHGLNLTEACRVINIDPWWNVAIEEQALARIFRIGQVRETEIVRLVLNSTIEAKMVARQKQKTASIDAVIDGKPNLTFDELSNLLDIDLEAMRDGRYQPSADNMFLNTLEDSNDNYDQDSDCVDTDEEDENDLLQPDVEPQPNEHNSTDDTEFFANFPNLMAENGYEAQSSDATEEAEDADTMDVSMFCSEEGAGSDDISAKYQARCSDAEEEEDDLGSSLKPAEGVSVGTNDVDAVMNEDGTDGSLPGV